ncbi:hypothetical protein [Proteocatella sphenisci]|uniref:hypothetical protein n=1 Tax=Proteocatella sphenisci TaxID=181070 RepID=UPI0004907026|nr:hypothetical protein [Proteocatella sphenisci]
MGYKNNIDSMLNSNSAFFLIENNGSVFESLVSVLSENYGIPDFCNNMDVRIYESSELQIADIKRIIFEIGLKPYGNTKFIIFKNFDRIGELAQNALLKSIEELPADTRVFAICNNTVNILDTIKSRAYYVYLNSTDVATVNEEKSLYGDATHGICEKEIFNIIESKYEKEEILDLLKNAITSMKDLLKDSLLSDKYATGIMHKIMWAQECHTFINANCNKNLCMDMLLYRILEEK